jgi:hypothetical protein
MVFNVGEEDDTMKINDVEVSAIERFRETTSRTVDMLTSCGLKTSVYYSVQKDEVYCLIGAPEWRLRQEADRLDHDVELDVRETIKQGKKFRVKLFEAVGSESPVDRDIKPYSWPRLYGPFKQFNKDTRRNIYKR